jgi:hypothetical protein
MFLFFNIFILQFQNIGLQTNTIKKAGSNAVADISSDLFDA